MLGPCREEVRARIKLVRDPENLAQLEYAVQCKRLAVPSQLFSDEPLVSTDLGEHVQIGPQFTQHGREAGDAGKVARKISRNSVEGQRIRGVNRTDERRNNYVQSRKR